MYGLKNLRPFKAAMSIKIGDTVYPIGRSPDYQRGHSISVNFLEWRLVDVTINGVAAEVSYQVASEDGREWYPVSTLAREGRK